MGLKSKLSIFISFLKMTFGVFFVILNGIKLFILQVFNLHEHIVFI